MNSQSILSNNNFSINNHLSEMTPSTSSSLESNFPEKSNKKNILIILSLITTIIIIFVFTIFSLRNNNPLVNTPLIKDAHQKKTTPTLSPSPQPTFTPLTIKPKTSGEIITEIKNQIIKAFE